MIEFFLERSLSNGRLDIVKLSCASSVEAWHDIKYKFNNKLYQKNGLLLIRITIDNLEAQCYMGLSEIRNSYLDYKIIQIKIDEMRELLKTGLQEK